MHTLIVIQQNHFPSGLRLHSFHLEIQSKNVPGCVVLQQSNLYDNTLVSMLGTAANSSNVCLLHTEILVAPNAQTVLLGTAAHFFCSGSGAITRWIINDIRIFKDDTDADFISRGFRFEEVDLPSEQIHNLSMTVEASQMNNNTKIQCGTFRDTVIVSNPVFLTIIGKSYREYMYCQTSLLWSSDCFRIGDGLICDTKRQAIFTHVCSSDYYTTMSVKSETIVLV